VNISPKNIRSWIVVLSLFFLAVILCVFWERFTSPPLQPLEAQPVADPKPALANVGASVVSLWAVKNKDLSTQISLIGCGLIVDPRGYILTSITLTADIESLYIIDRNEAKHEVKVIATDKITRLTLLNADPVHTTVSKGFEAAYLGDSRQVRQGDTVFAIGGKMTPSSWELTTKTGRITRQRQSLVVDKMRYRDLIQTDLKLSLENSGGPLINMKGEVIGFALPSVQPPNCPGFSYAIPIDQGKYFLAKLPIPQWTEGPADQVCNWLGAETVPLNPAGVTELSFPKRRGEIVSALRNNSPMERAGLRRGDVITGINGNTIADRFAFDRIAPQLCQTDKIKLAVLREGHPKNLTVYWNKAAYFLPGRGSLAEVILVVLIFSLMYSLIYKNVLDRVVLFVLGATIIAVIGRHLGFYDQGQIASALLTKIDVLCFLVGMQLIIAVLEDAGALEYLAKKITIATGGNTWRIMVFFCLATYAISLVVNNLTTIMLMAPMVLKLSKYMQIDPKPFLASMIIASNLGGASTMVGDFPNMLIGAETGLSFLQFSFYMLPICLLELFVLLLFIRISRAKLFARGTQGGNSPAGESSRSSRTDEFQDCRSWNMDIPELADNPRDDGQFFHNLRQSLPGTINNPQALKKGLVILAGVTVAFVFSDLLHCTPATIALAGGIIALAFGACDPISLLRKVGIMDILFFSGLFVLVGAAEASGAIGYISKMIIQFSFGNVLILCLLLMWFGALVTCFLNAGPTTALFMPIVFSFNIAAPHNLYWWALSLGVCAGSSGTLAGATAGSVTATMLDKFIKKEKTESIISPRSAAGDEGRLTQLTFKGYAALGLPMMLIFLLISSIYITVIYRW